MSLISYKRGQGSIVLRVKILDSSVSTGAGKTGLTSASSGLIISTIADNEATATAYTVAGSTIEGITTLGTYAAPTATKCRFREVDSTNHKGVYEIQIADARYAVSSAKSLVVSISGASNAAETDCVIPLTDMDPYDAVRAGLTTLPNAVAGANGGLPLQGSAIPNANANANGGLPILSSSGTTLAYTLSTLTTYTGNTPQTGDSYSIVNSGTFGNSALKSLIDAVDNFVDTEIAATASDVTTLLSRLGTPSNLGGGATVAANLADIESQTDDIGLAGVGLTAIPWNAFWDAEVQSEVQDAIEVNNLDHLVKVAVDTNFATTVALDSVIGHLVDNGTSATFDRTTDSLEALQAEHDATQALVAASAIRAALGLSSANMDSQFSGLDSKLDAIDNFIDTEVGAILAAVDTEVGAIKTVTDKLDTALELDGSVYRFTVNALEQAPSGGGGGSTDWTADERTAIRTILGIPSSGTTPEAPSAGALKLIDDFLDTEIAALQSDVAAILLDSNELQTDWANGGRLDLILDGRASQSSVDTLATYVDTEVAAILTAVDTEIAAILQDTGTDIPAAIAALLTTAGAESYRADGSTGSVFQLLYEILAHHAEKSISGTSLITKCLDGTTTAATHTLDSATTPTSITRAA